MTLHPLMGHSDARSAVAAAMASGRLPQLLLVVGPQGVGKQRFALWIAQLLLCSDPKSEPCGTCDGCRRVLSLAHPDLHWFFPVPRPKGADQDRQVQELEQAIGEAIEARRNKPLYGPPDGLSGHFVATARSILRRAALTPSMSARKVFIVGDAERLVPQEANPEAANALLKLLEEPPADTYLVLTAADPQGVLPTIRSRAVPVRLRTLDDQVVEQFLATHLEPTERGLAKDRAQAARGSIGAAVSDQHAMLAVRRSAVELLEACLAGPAARGERILRQAPWAARGDFTALLEALAETLGDVARSAAGEPPLHPLPARLLAGRTMGAVVAAEQLVYAARDAAQGNVNPQLLLGTLAEDLAEVL